MAREYSLTDKPHGTYNVWMEHSIRYIEADSLDEAVEFAFSDECDGLVEGEEDLRRLFPQYEPKGWCWVERDRVCLIEIGDCPYFLVTSRRELAEERAAVED